MIEVTRTVTFTVDPESWAEEFGITVEDAEQDFTAYLDSGYVEDSLVAGLGSLRNADGTVRVH